MSGTRQKIQYSLALVQKAGVKPRPADTKGPTHPWRSPHPNARPAQNN